MHLNYSYLHCTLFLFLFYPKINKANITIILLIFQVSKMDLTSFLGQLVSMLRVKLKKVIIRGKYVFKFRSNSSQNSQTFLRLWHFFSLRGYPFNSIFQWSYIFIRFSFLMKHFFLLTIRMAMITKLFRVVTCFKELSSIDMHDISTEWSCWVMWQIKYISLPAEDVSTPN